jgi:predicted nucleotidyltransferase
MVHDRQDVHLKEIVRRLSEKYNPIKIYLFGSRARGDFSIPETVLREGRELHVG